VVPYYPLNLAATTTPAQEQAAESALLLAAAQIMERSNFKEGIPRLEALIAQYHPRSADFYVALADGFAAQELYGKAVPHLEQAARLAPASAIVLRKLGSAQLHAGLMNDAEATLRRVTSMAPGDDGAWGLLAQFLTIEGARRPGVTCDGCDRMLAEAKAAYLKGVAINPELPDLRTSFATMLFATGDTESAEREFREAVRIQPGVAEMQANLASVLASRGETVEARFHFEASIRLRPDFAPGRLNYAHMLAGLGDAAEAEKQARAALQANDNLTDAHELLGSLLEGRNDLDGAEPELRAAVRLRPDFGQAHFELAVVLWRKGDTPEAVEHLKIAAQGPDANARTSAERFLQYLEK
jgi:tetratricopeptide (TPR) repeat protein